MRELILPMHAESTIVLTNLRHKIALMCGEHALADASSGLRQLEPPELVAVALQKVRESLEEIIGLVQNDDILERIFSKFCIGK